MRRWRGTIRPHIARALGDVRALRRHDRDFATERRRWTARRSTRPVASSGNPTLETWSDARFIEALPRACSRFACKKRRASTFPASYPSRPMIAPISVNCSGEIAAVDQPQAERAALEQIVDAEAGRDPAEADRKAGERGDIGGRAARRTWRGRRRRSGSSRKAPPKIIAIEPDLSFSSLCPVSAIHLLANSSGEYHRPPSRKADKAASKTAR